MPFKYGKLRKGVLAALTGVKQESLATWFEELDKQAMVQKQAIENEKQIRSKLFPKLLELHAQGLSCREISKVMGVSHATIARYLQLAKQAQLNASTT